MFPRALLPRVKAREALGQTGVYLLLGPREDGDGKMLYIGEGTRSARGWKATTRKRISGVGRCASWPRRRVLQFQNSGDHYFGYCDYFDCWLTCGSGRSRAG